MDRRTSFLCLSISFLLFLSSSPQFTPRVAAQAGYSGRLAYLRIADALKSKGYSIALDGLGISGLNDTLIKLLPTRNVTILVPTNGAFYKLTAAPWKGLKKTPDKLRQILAYHTLRTRMRFLEIKELSVGTTVRTGRAGRWRNGGRRALYFLLHPRFPSLHFPLSPSLSVRNHMYFQLAPSPPHPHQSQVPTLDFEFTMARIKDTRPIMGAKGSRIGALIIDPNVYSDPRVMIHGVNMVVMPPKLY
ncbi:unnamed protein product [Closterium sp. Yama58-4]|nr:unnamed protein product [Closterium sp. Yama58-4]